MALRLGAAWAGDAKDGAGAKLDTAIIFAPAGALVPLALSATRKGGTVALAGITMSPIPQLDYELLYEERVLRSVANSTRRDVQEFLPTSGYCNGPDAFTFTAANAAGTSAPATVAITVSGSALVVTPPLAPAQVGVPYSRSIFLGGTPPYNLTAEGLPPGLSMDGATGAISGTAIFRWTIRFRGQWDRQHARPRRSAHRDGTHAIERDGLQPFDFAKCVSRRQAGRELLADNNGERWHAALSLFHFYRLVIAQRIKVDGAGVDAAVVVACEIVHADRLAFPTQRTGRGFCRSSRPNESGRGP